MISRADNPLLWLRCEVAKTSQGKKKQNEIALVYYNR